MSKFFNQTLKARTPIFHEQGFDFTGLQEIAENDAQTVSKPGDPVPEQSELGKVKKVIIPQSKLLLTKFEGSDSLQSAEESYRALRTRLLRLHTAGGLRSVVITSSIPGEGKTLTSLNLALSCSQLHDMRILLVDGDIRTSGLTRSLGIAPMPGLADVLSGQGTAESVVLETNHPNLFFCGAGSAMEPPAELFAGQRWQEFIERCSESFKLVLVDSPPILNLADVELMTAACDGVLLVVRARHTRRDVLQKSASQIDAQKLLGVVYNGSERAQHGYYAAVGKEK